MLKLRLKQLVPDYHKLSQYKVLKPFEHLIIEPKLWHISRRSIICAVTIGLFCAWIPLPFHTIIAVALAIALHCNLPMTMLTVWLSNPLTLAPQIYLAHKVGHWLVEAPQHHLYVEPENIWQKLVTVFEDEAKPLLFGSLACGIASALLGNIIIRLLWRYYIIIAWKKRQRKYRLKF